jgi:hypothetical protein
MIPLKLWRALALAVFAAALPAHAGEVYQISTISSLLAGGYDGDTTVAELLRHGTFGLGTFNGVDGEMMVLDGRVYRGTIDGRAHAVTNSALTPFAVVVAFRPQGSAPVVAGQSLEQLEAALDAALQPLARARGAHRRPVSSHRHPQRAQTTTSLSPLARGDQRAAGRPHLRGHRRYPDRLPFPGRYHLRQRARLAFPLFECRPQSRRTRPRPDHRRRPGLDRGMLRTAHQLARAGPGIERRRRCNQGGGTPAVTSRAQVRLLGRHKPNERRRRAAACEYHPRRFLLRRTENRGWPQFRYCPPSRGSI